MVEAFARGVRMATECRRLEGLVTWYQRRCEKLRADLDAREAEKKGLHHQLEETLEKVGADAAQAK